MTKSTITREQLLEIIETDHVQCGEASYLARIALLAMDSEQVAENIRIADALEGLLWPNMAIGNKAVIQAAIEALRAYHAQPAPVVPNGLRLALSNAGIAAPESDEMLAATCEKHIQALVTWVKDRKPFQSAPVVPDAYVRDESGRMMLNGVCEPKIGFGTGWNACRAAMLQASNSPAQSDCCPAQNHVSPEQNSVSPAQSPIDHGYRPECECSGCKATARICAELSANSTANPDCWCRTCRPVTLNDMRFVVCPDCGNKRCPRANDHRNACTGSNEPGQEGSAYPDTLREVK